MATFISQYLWILCFILKESVVFAENEGYYFYLNNEEYQKPTRDIGIAVQMEDDSVVWFPPVPVRPPLPPNINSDQMFQFLQQLGSQNSTGINDFLNPIIDISRNKTEKETAEIKPTKKPPKKGNKGRCKCERGPRGPNGPTGKRGPRGQKGKKGETGEKGDTGPAGPPGPESNMVSGGLGGMGLPGTRGPPGPEGPMGPRGSAGNSGERGLQGFQGPPGPPGEGQPGYPGQPGIPGAKGRDGIPGLVVFTDGNAMYSVTIEGLIAYRTDNQQLYVRDHTTWRKVQMSRCGDGVLDAESGEQCDDGNDILSDSCISCRRAYCGDGIVQEGVEECDGSDFYGKSCYTWRPGSRGTLTCSRNCRINYSNCRADRNRP